MAAMDDLKLLRGGVPQLPDLVRLWAWLQKPVSFTAMESFSLSESFLQHARADISRRAAAAMVKVLAEVVRKHKVQALAEASCICLMMDERAPHYILRYRCDSACKG